MEFSKQEYWSGVPCPPPGDPPDPWIEPTSLASPTTSTTWEAVSNVILSEILNFFHKIENVKRMLDTTISIQHCTEHSARTIREKN